MNLSKRKNQYKSKNQYGPSRKILSLITCAVLLLLCYGSLANQRGKLITRDTTTAKEDGKTFQEIGFFGQIKEDKWTSFLQAVQRNIANSRMEPGNLSFSMFQPESGDLEPIWFERFVTKQAHNHHKQQGYFKDAIRVIQESLLGEAVPIELEELEELPAAVAKKPSDTGSSRYVVVFFDVKPDKRELFIQSIAQAGHISRKAKGNLEFNLYRYVGEPDKFVLMEGWESMDDHEAQLEMRHIQQLNDAIQDFFVSSPMETRWILKDISQ